jgi:hypothetical protein
LKTSRWPAKAATTIKYQHTEAVDPVSGLIAPLYNPRRDHWSNHFVWSADLLVLVGLTPTGRATIATLRLNRTGVVNLRRLLLGVGEHPHYRSRINPDLRFVSTSVPQ